MAVVPVVILKVQLFALSVCQFQGFLSVSRFSVSFKEEVHSAPSTGCRHLPPAALASTQTPHIKLKWPVRGVPCMFYSPNSNRLVGNLCSTLSLFTFKGTRPLKHSLSKKTNLSSTDRRSESRNFNLGFCFKRPCCFCF